MQLSHGPARLCSVIAAASSLPGSCCAWLAHSWLLFWSYWLSSAKLPPLTQVLSLPTFAPQMKNTQLYYFRICLPAQLLGTESPPLNLFPSLYLLANVLAIDQRQRPLVRAPLRSYMIALCLSFQSVAQKLPFFSCIYFSFCNKDVLAFSSAQQWSPGLLYWSNQESVREPDLSISTSYDIETEKLPNEYAKY